MQITKAGNSEFTRKEEFFFRCKKCGCEWYAGRGDKELHISPPCFEFFTYMECPNCGEMAYDRGGK